eukprot:COSAG06_NODE_58009_length_278_cov_0.860335_1_plen_40_part_10
MLCLRIAVVAPVSIVVTLGIRITDLRLGAGFCLTVPLAVA